MKKTLLILMILVSACAKQRRLREDVKGNWYMMNGYEQIFYIFNPIELRTGMFETNKLDIQTGVFKDYYKDRYKIVGDKIILLNRKDTMKVIDVSDHSLHLKIDNNYVHLKK